jgi:hypothetical protein
MRNKIVDHKPAQFDEAWFKKGSRTAWLVKWGTTDIGFHQVLVVSLSGKNSAGISKYINKVISKYPVGRVDRITCDFRVYFGQRLKERGEEWMRLL